MSMFVSDGNERVNPNGGWLRYSASAISNTPPIGHMRRRTSLTSVTSSIRPQCAPSGGFSWLGLTRTLHRIVTRLGENG